MTGKKICSKCKEEKESVMFSKNISKKDGLSAQCKACERHFNIYKRKIENKLLALAKYRAKKKNLEFNLTLEDIKIPANCPILGIKLQKNRGGKTAAEGSPSIDRIDNTRGYVRDNIKIISYKANTLKSFASKEELKKVIQYMENKPETLFSRMKNKLSNIVTRIKCLLKK